MRQRLFGLDFSNQRRKFFLIRAFSSTVASIIPSVLGSIDSIPKERASGRKTEIVFGHRTLERSSLLYMRKINTSPSLKRRDRGDSKPSTFVGKPSSSFLAHPQPIKKQIPPLPITWVIPRQKHLKMTAFNMKEESLFLQGRGIGLMIERSSDRERAMNWLLKI